MRKTIPFQKVLMLKADVNYTIIHFHDGTSEIYSYTLKYFEKLLMKNTSFVRIHRSYLVNRKAIQIINPSNVVLHSGVVLPIARRRKV